MIRFLDRVQSYFEVQARNKRIKKKLAKKQLEKEQELKKNAPVSEPKEISIDDKIERLNKMENPILFLVNSNLTSTPTEVVTDEEIKEGQQNYKEFLSDPDKTKDIFNTAVNLSNVDGIHSWICSKKHLSDLTASADFHGIVYTSVDLPDNFLEQREPFKEIKVKLEGEIKSSKVKLDMNSAWKPIADSLNIPEDKEEEETDEETETKKEEPKKTIKKEEDVDQDILDDTGDEDAEDEEDTDTSLDIKKSKVNIGKLRSLKDPYIFILDPRERYAEYRNFIEVPDLDDVSSKASKVLPKAIKFLVSSKIKSQEGAPVLVYFLGGKDVQDIKTELRRESRPHFKLAPFDKSRFDSDLPFADLTLGKSPVESALIDELNNVWSENTSKISGNPMPAVQASTSIPLNFFRFLSKKQRPVRFYIGNRPLGAGSSGIIYVLASEKEGEAFINFVKKFKMPSLFYERMSANYDIDAEFKPIEPEEYTPANVLILRADAKFDPDAKVEITDINKDLLASSELQIYEAIKTLETDKEKYKDKIKQLTQKLQDEVTQLYMLHEYARKKLGSKIQNPGSFITSGVSLGTHIANFNADMTYCFLWGTITRHVAIDQNELVKQLPFVKTVITNYL